MKKILSLLLAAVMVLSMLSVIAFADEAQQAELPSVEQPFEEPVDEEPVAEEQAEVYNAAAPLSGGVEVELKGIHNAQIASLKVYSYDGKVKGDADFLDGNTAIADGYQLKYIVTLPEGEYWAEGYDEKGNLNGGIAFTVDADHTVFTFRRVYGIYASNSGWVYGTDYDFSLDITGKDGTKREVTIGDADNWGTLKKSCLFMDGDTVIVTFNPLGEKAETAMPVTVRKSGNQTTNNNIDVYAKIPQALAITIKAPKGSTISTGTFGTYYVYNFFEMQSCTEDENGVTAVFKVPDSVSGNTFYRVQNPQGVTYWQFEAWRASKEITVTAEDLHIGDSSFNKNTVYRFEKNVYDRADIYLNINGKGYMDMSVGETFELNVFRNWMAIESFFNAKVALPDMHYQVVDFYGNPSDVVSITPDENNSSVAKMVANKAGTAVVLVTYDAMTYMLGQSSTKSKEFSAIWPECTGVFVVSVGADGSSIETNMTLDRIDGAESVVDAEHDILFYMGSKGATYTFTPEDECTVSVARPNIKGNTLSYSGFTYSGVSVGKNHEVTVTGLTTGRNIIKIEKNGVATYQVITAREVSYKMYDSEGNEIDFYTNRPKAGEKVKIQFTNLINPIEKLSGAYNFNASIYYKAENETTFRSNPGGGFGVYDFSGNPVRQLIEITVPADWENDSYSLVKGAIKMGGFGTFRPGYHRGITYATGLDPNFNAPTSAMVLSRIDGLSIPVANAAYEENRPLAAAVEDLINQIGEITETSGTKLVAALDAYNALTDAQKELVRNYDVLAKAEREYRSLFGSAAGGETIHIGAAAAAAEKGEENPNTGAEVIG